MLASGAAGAAESRRGEQGGYRNRFARSATRLGTRYLGANPAVGVLAGAKPGFVLGIFYRHIQFDDAFVFINVGDHGADDGRAVREHRCAKDGIDVLYMTLGCPTWMALVKKPIPIIPGTKAPGKPSSRAPS